MRKLELHIPEVHHELRSPFSMPSALRVYPEIVQQAIWKFCVLVFLCRDERFSWQHCQER
jgi:hypothetical protein